MIKSIRTHQSDSSGFAEVAARQGNHFAHHGYHATCHGCKPQMYGNCLNSKHVLPMKFQNVGYGAITLEWILEPSGPGAYRM